MYVYVCLWGDHFSEERVKFWMRKVVVDMHIHTHCTLSEWQLDDQYSVGKGMKLERWVLDQSGKAQVHN